MKKYIIGLLSILLLTGCIEEKKIVVNQINTGYTVNDITTLYNMPVNSRPWANVNVDEKFLAITKFDENYEINGYTIFNPATNEVKELNEKEAPEIEHEEYGWLTIPTKEYNIYYKIIYDENSGINNYKYYVEKMENIL